jgi:hypothetical protein
MFEEPIGIAYSPIWKTPDVKLFPHEIVRCATCEGIPSGTAPRGIYLCYPLLFIELSMVWLISLATIKLLSIDSIMGDRGNTQEASGLKGTAT